MATVDKAFRIKNGLVVEGSSATVNGSNVLTEASTEFLQDTTAAMFTNGTQTGITFTYNDSTGVIDAAVSTTPTFSDRIIFEGNTPDSYELTLLSPEPVADVTVTLPNATTTLVGKDTTDTFTNKTFDTASTGNTLQINGNTVNSYVGSGSNVVLSSSPTITSLYVANGLNVNGATTGTTQIVAANTASGVLTLPAATGTIALTSDIPSLTGYVTETGTQTLTNKTISGTSNTITNIANGSLENSSITVNANTASLGGSITLDTDDISEAGTSATNLWFTNERAQDAVAQAIANGTQTNITITYDDTANSLSFNASGGVSSISGTANQIAASASTGAVTLSLPDAVTFPGTVTLNADPVNALEAATKQYVDAATAGLNVHASVQAATTANITLATDVENGDTLDGVTLATGNRILIKNQTTKSQNGVYTVNASGAPTRATDYNAAGEVDAGDFIFVEAGTVNGKTGWVQTNVITTVGTDNIEFTQFSGAGTITAGTNISVSGGQVSVVNDPTFSGVVTASSGVAFSDGTQTKEGVPSRTPIIQKTDSYTLSALTERDNVIEMGKATAQTLTIPTNATVAYPVGTSIDVLQVGSGQITIAGDTGVTVNATPGLKLRTQWSSATLFKRAENSWVVYGDLAL